MFITVDLLKKVNACSSGLIWFRNHYPDGAELADIADQEYVTSRPNLLHWCRDNFTLTKEEEEKFYFKPLNIINSNHIERSQNVLDSNYIVRCENVECSSNIFSSNNIRNSQNIVSCDEIENSKSVFNSSFVYDSQKIIDSVNVNNSTNIISSKYIIKSANIYQSSSVSRSGEIYKGNALKDCYFCRECSNLKNAFFCVGITDQENVLFNKPIDADELQIIKKQYNSIMKELLCYVKEWPEEIFTFTIPTVDLNFLNHYSTIKDKFWKWVKTLPNYSDEFMFYLTSLPEFLTK